MSEILRMREICKDYSMGEVKVKALDHVNLAVEQGEYLAVMGPSGSGKTTLMNMIGCLDVPDSGDYFLNGKEIAKCSERQLADLRNKTIGFVFQSFYLLPKLSALDNVALPLLYAGVKKAERKKRAMKALQMVGLEDRAQFRSSQMSGGQCQRVAIARAMVTEPNILLADEPTGALDSASGAQIMELFREINERGTTIIMITHDQNVADHAEKIVHIFDGKLEGGELNG